MPQIRIVFSHLALNLLGQVEDPSSHCIEQFDQAGFRDFLVGGMQMHHVNDPILIMHDKVGWLRDSCLAALSVACRLLVSGYAFGEVSFSCKESVGFVKRGRWNQGLHLRPTRAYEKSLRNGRHLSIIRKLVVFSRSRSAPCLPRF
jgi:hypothetical protein